MIAIPEANHPVIKLAALVLIRADFWSKKGPQKPPKALIEDPLSEHLKLGFFTSENPKYHDIHDPNSVGKILAKSK